MDRSGLLVLRVLISVLGVLSAVTALALWAPKQPDAAPGLSAKARLGEKIFEDTRLSGSGKLSCATCHESAHAHAAPDQLAAPLGGTQMDLMGFRNTPTLRYLQDNIAFHFDAEQTPTGGFNWDGRAKDFAAQSTGPLFSPHEMALTGPAELQIKLRAAAYADEFRKVFGAAALDESLDVVKHTGAALAAFQKEDPRFHPYDSKYDFFLAGQLKLSAQEQRGLGLFNDEKKGNCAACHPSARGPQGEPPLFTDFTYDVLGAPRNRNVAATHAPEYFDLGLCGPDRKDLSARKDLCGAFKVPTLRNIVNTAPYFHNGVFTTLEQAVEFYARRDTHPEQWYPKDAQGMVKKFDDLPVEYHANVNVSEAPYDRKPGDAPALTPDEIKDVVAFLKTLTDGYQP